MDLTLSRNFNQNEKVAALKLMIKIASSDGEISESEKASLGEYLKHTKLKTNENFIKNVINEDIGQIVSVFESKINLQRVQKLARAYAEKHGVDPDFEGALLAVIDESVAAEKKNKKFFQQKASILDRRSMDHPETTSFETGTRIDKTCSEGCQDKSC